jgi:hypothetical protein
VRIGDSAYTQAVTLRDPETERFLEEDAAGLLEWWLWCCTMDAEPPAYGEDVHFEDEICDEDEDATTVVNKSDEDTATVVNGIDIDGAKPRETTLAPTHKQIGFMHFFERLDKARQTVADREQGEEAKACLDLKTCRGECDLHGTVLHGYGIIKSGRLHRCHEHDALGGDCLGLW